MRLLNFLFLLIFFLNGHILFAQGNPFVRDIYTADPSAHVWEDGRLYVYPSHDIDPPNGCDRMDKYHVYSTDDMINWTDHGQIVEAADVPWDEPITNASTNATFMWAPDCAYKNGTYYFYFPHPKGPTWNDTWQIGIATSSKPASDFTVLDEPLKGTEVSWTERGNVVTSPGLIDPCVFVDDDGEVYFYMGGGNRCFAGKLKENMIEVDGELQEMTGLYDFHEAAWVFKRNGIYYLTYADNNSGANRLRHATSDNPLGPWTHKGIYLNPTSCDTSHGSVVEYKGQWWAFYHTADLSGNGALRSICVDSLFFKEDGSIQMVRQTKYQGSPYKGVMPTVPGTIEAEDYNEGGKGIAYWDNTPGNRFLEYRNDDVDINRNVRRNMYYISDMAQGEYINYTFEVVEDDVYTIDFVIGATQSGQTQKFYLEFDYIKMTNPREYTVPYAPISALETVTVPNISLTKGVHTMRFIPRGNMNLDKFTFTGTKSGIYNTEYNAVFVSADQGQGMFTIHNIETHALATVLDVNGRVLFSKMVSANENVLQLSGYAKGVYFLQLQTDKNIIKRKLINP